MELPVKIVVRDFPPVFKLLKGIIVSSISCIVRKAGIAWGIFPINVYLGAAYVYPLWLSMAIYEYLFGCGAGSIWKLSVAWLCHVQLHSLGGLRSCHLHLVSSYAQVKTWHLTRLWFSLAATFTPRTSTAPTIVSCFASRASRKQGRITVIGIYPEQGSFCPQYIYIYIYI